MKHSLLDAFLIGGAIALGGYLVATAGGPTTGEIEAREKNLFTSFDPATIESISLSAAGKRKVNLTRRKDELDPHRYRLGDGGQYADPANVSELLSTLEFATWSRTLDGSSALSNEELGFTEPQVEVQLQAGARSARLLIGGPAPRPANALYARISGQGLESVTGVVESSLLQTLQRGEQEFRGSLLFSLSRSQTSSLTISSGDNQLVLHADELGFVSHSSTPETRADSELTDLVFFQLARAKMETYLEPKKVKKLQKEAARELVFITQQGVKKEGAPAKTYEVTLGGSCPGTTNSTLAYRTKPDEIAGCVTNTVLAAFRTPAANFADHTSVPLAPDEIDHVVLKEKERTLDVIRRGDKLVLLGEKERALPQEGTNEFLEALSKGRLVLLTDAPTLGDPTGSLTVKGHTKRTATAYAAGVDDQSQLVAELHLDIYRLEGQVIIHRKDDDRFLEVPSWLHWAFSANDGWTRDRKLGHWQVDDFERIRVTLPGSYSQQVLIQADGSFEMESSGSTSSADPRRVRDLLRELGELKAKRFIVPAIERPSSKTIEVVFSTKEHGDHPAEEHTLWIGSRTRGGYLAWATFAEGSFVVPFQTQQLCEMPLGNRSRARPDPADMAIIEATISDRDYRFERVAGSLRAAGGQAVDEMVEPLEEALRGLDVVARLDQHPAGRSMTRGKPQLALRMTPLSGTSAPYQLLIGGPAVFQSRSVLVAWIDGSPENYIISRSSLQELIELL